MLATATVSTSGTGPDINLIQGWDAAVICCTVNTVSGTSPTLDVYIQKRIPQAATTDVSGGIPSGTAIYDDILHFTQITTSATTRVSHISNYYLPATSANATVLTTADWLQQDAALTAGNLRVGPIAGDWRVKYTVAGTSPTMVMTVTAELT
jgi:hypothetical protein